MFLISFPGVLAENTGSDKSADNVQINSMNEYRERYNLWFILMLPDIQKNLYEYCSLQKLK